jgi:hypothetical protein
LPSPDWFAFLSVLDSLLSTVPSSASSISSGNGEFNRRNAAFLHLLLEAHSFLYLFLDCWITSQVTICSGFSSYLFTYPWFDLFLLVVDSSISWNSKASTYRIKRFRQVFLQLSSSRRNTIYSLI